MDLTSYTLAGLMTIGFVNVITMFKPDLDSRLKFGASILVAFAIGFIPADIGNVILEHLKEAITVAFAASGAYKLTQIVGSK